VDCVVLPEAGWADTLTDISVGYLLTEASKAANLDCEATSILKNALFHEDPCSYDSFDAAVALHTSHYQAAEQPAHTSHSTIWGAEETCDEFSFKLATARKQEGSNTSASSPPDSENEVRSSNSEGFQSFLEVGCHFGGSEQGSTCLTLLIYNLFHALGLGWRRDSW
jgi:hypothetical protein